jgi:NAD(P)-dependent dehydrogenase (short-subunit alcohol dehydrogenase family)
MSWILLLLAAILVIAIVRWYRHRKRLSDLDNRCIFITGCDTGFGNEAARRLDVAGVSVFAGCLTERGADELRKRCSKRLQTILLDVTQSDSIQHALAIVEAKLQRGQGNTVKTQCRSENEDSQSPVISSPTLFPYSVSLLFQFVS